MKFDKIFHHYLYGLANNSAMQIICDGLYDAVDRIWLLPRQIYPERIKAAQQEHIAIINALQERDADKSEAALRNHFKVLHREIEKMNALNL